MLDTEPEKLPAIRGICENKLRNIRDSYLASHGARDVVAYERMTLHAIGSYNAQIAYCIEPGVDQDSGNTLTSTDESCWDKYPASSNVTIPPETIKTLPGRVLICGYHGNILKSPGKPVKSMASRSRKAFVAPFLLIEF